MGLTIIKGGTIVTPHSEIQGDVLVEGEKIIGIVQSAEVGPDDTVIDAAGMLVFPGIVDAHTHIKLDTGIYQTADNWEIGTRAAAFGGVTTVIDFANQIIGQPYAEALKARQQEAADAVIDYAFHMVMLDPDRDPDRLKAELQELLDMGVTSLKLFTTYRPNYYVDDATMVHIFRAMPEGMIAMVHCENDSLVTDATQRLIEAGTTGWAYHGKGRPPLAEIEAVRRVSHLGISTGARVYIVHCSTTQSVSGVMEANQVRKDRRSRDQDRVFCETCPQYLLLDSSRYEGEKPEHYILQPPLRHFANNKALRADVVAGRVDVLSTDTCDYSLEQKVATPDFTQTPGGLPGVETLLPAMYTTFRESMPLPQLIRLMTENPARLFGLYPRKGAILPGSDADLVIYDPESQVEVKVEDLHYLAGYNPFEGMTMQGKVRTVLSRGKVIVDKGEFFGEAGRGAWLPGGASLPPE